MRTSLIAVGLIFALVSPGSAEEQTKAAKVLAGLRKFYAQTARADGSFQPGIDPKYRGMSDSAYSDLAAVTYACTIHKTFGWELPHEKKTIEWLLNRQLASGEFVNEAGTVDPKSPQGRVYNTTQALVALHALGVKPRHDALPMFEEILKQDYKTLPAYSTSFFPLAYLCAGQPIPEQADRAIRALMVPDGEGYLNDHIAATFHSSHYYALVGEPTPKSQQMVRRILRDQNRDGSWLVSPFARDRHATFDAVFSLKHEAPHDPAAQQAVRRAAAWALSCRNDDGGFGHYPGSTSDADAVYFQVGTLVMAGVLAPIDPLPRDPQVLSWGHLMPEREDAAGVHRLALPGWVGSVALTADGRRLAAGAADGVVRVWKTHGYAAPLELKGTPSAISAVAFSPDGKQLLSGSYDHTATLWDSGSGNALAKLEGHRGAVTSVAFAPQESLVATASIDGDVRLWKSTDGALVRTLRGHKSWVNAIAFTPGGKQLLCGSSDGTLRVWDVASGDVVKSLEITPAEVRSIAISADGKSVAAGLRYGGVKLYRTSDWTETQSLAVKGDDVWSLAFDAQGEHLFIASGEWNRPTSVRRWHLRSQKFAGEFKHPGEVLSLAVSKSGHLATGGGDATVSIFTIP